MYTYGKDQMAQKKYDFDNIVIPTLVNYGWHPNTLRAMFDAKCVRLRWGRDWNNFTIHASNPNGEPTWVVDEQIHTIWNGGYVAPKQIMACFLPAMGHGPISSVAITDIHTLANAMKQFGEVPPVRNRHNGQTFMTLPFNHHSLWQNMWGLNVKQ